MKKQLTLTVDGNLLTFKVTFPSHEEANALYDNLIAIFKAGKDASLELSNPEPTQ